MNLLNRGPDFCQVSPDQTNTTDSEIRKEDFFTGLQYFAISNNVLAICPVSTVMKRAAWTRWIEDCFTTIYTCKYSLCLL